MGGQRAAVRAPARRALGFDGGRDLLGGVAGRFDQLGHCQPEQELILRQALGARPEAVTLHGLDDLAQSLVLGPFLGEQRSEGRGIVGRRSRHEAE